MILSKKGGDNTEDTPTISIIIPVYNQPDLLEDALDSVSDQTFDDFEAIIIDDNSDTDFEAIVNQYGEWARLITHTINKGAAEARNTGIEAARGDYIAFLDADDRWRSTKLKKQIAVFRGGDEELGLVYTGLIQVDIDGSEWRRYPEAAGNIYLQELERDRIYPTSTVMIRKECLEKVGGFDPSLRSRQDYDLWIRITEYYNVESVDEILVEKREQPNSISNDFESRIQGDLTVFRKVRNRAKNMSFITRCRIFSHHYYMIGRDYELNGNRRSSLKFLALSILRYPFRPITWAILVIALFGIDREGTLMTFAKQFVR